MITHNAYSDPNLWDLLKFFFGNHCANEYDGYFFFPGFQMFFLAGRHSRVLDVT